MMTLIAAAALAAQTAPPANPHGSMAPMQPGQHESMKKDCCKDCCKDMAAKHEGHGERGGHSGSSSN
jgi:hypothetical protein